MCVRLYINNNAVKHIQGKTIISVFIYSESEQNFVLQQQFPTKHTEANIKYKCSQNSTDFLLANTYI